MALGSEFRHLWAEGDREYRRRMIEAAINAHVDQLWEDLRARMMTVERHGGYTVKIDALQQTAEVLVTDGESLALMQGAEAVAFIGEYAACEPEMVVGYLSGYDSRNAGGEG